MSEEEKNVDFVITAVFRVKGSWMRITISGQDKRTLGSEITARIRRVLAKAEEEPTVLELHWGAVKADDKPIGSYLVYDKI